MLTHNHNVPGGAEKLMQDDVEKIVNAVLTAAHNGDMRSNSFDLPRIERPADAHEARAATLNAVADGNLTPSDAADVFELIRRVARILA